ncbi:hypothetical protein UXO04_22320, partial [Enterobacter kobei]|uniref:hypothetical protein n=2 Tax=Enterobacter cloacae complex TaxID=354276 RepID=UPI002FD3BD11
AIMTPVRSPNVIWQVIEGNGGVANAKNVDLQTDIKILIEIIIGDIVSASGGLQGWINHAGDVSMIVTFIFPRLAVARSLKRSRRVIHIDHMLHANQVIKRR